MVYDAVRLVVTGISEEFFVFILMVVHQKSG